MQRKYHCALVDLWRRSMRAFVLLVNCAIHAFSIHFASANAVTEKDNIALDAFWDKTLDALEACLYTSTALPAMDVLVTDEERRSDDALQLQLVNLIKDLLSPPEIARGSAVERSQSVVPSNKVQRCIGILQRGATATMTSEATSPASAGPFAEEFAKACFSALLEPKVTSRPVEQQSAIAALVDKCRASLIMFAETPVKLEASAADLQLVLKAVSDVLDSDYRKAGRVLFTALVDCAAAANDKAMRGSILGVLRKFEQFLA